MNMILLGMALLSVSLPTVRLDAQEPTLVLARIPYDSDTFDTMELIRPLDASEPPFRVGQSIHVWNGSSSSAHELEVDAIREEAFDQWFSKLVIAYHPTLEREERDSGSHLCPRPGFDPSYGGPVDPRGHTYQLASDSAFPEQSWRCSELTPSEVEEVSEAAGLPLEPWVGFTKIIRGSGIEVRQPLHAAADQPHEFHVVAN